MKSAFMSVLRGDTLEGEIEISLKSCVPVFIAFPELLTYPNKGISAVMPYYRPGVDYGDTVSNIDIGKSEIELLSMFNAVFSTVLSNSLFKSEEMELPRLYVNIDIGYGPTVYGRISPNHELSDSLGSKHFCEGLGLKFNLAMYSKDKVSESQKHNILLLQALRKRCNDGGIWR